MEDNGITLGEIFRLIFRRIWWVVGVTLAFLVIAALLVQFWYNPKDRQYSCTYTVTFPGSEQGVYPDGSAIKYQESVSPESLKAVRDESYVDESLRTGEFKDIDVEAMSANGGIAISYTAPVVEDSVITEPSVCTLTADASYFSSQEQASRFLAEVAGYPVRKAQQTSANTSRDKYLTMADSANSYEDKLEYLLGQRRYLTLLYYDLGKTYGQSYSPVEGETVGNLREEVEAVLGKSEQERIENIISGNNLIIDTEGYLATADAEKAALNSEIALNEAIITALQEKIDELQNAESGLGLDMRQIEAYHSQIAKYVVKNAELQVKVATIEKTVAAIADYDNPETETGKIKQALDAEFADVRAQLAALTDKADSVLDSVYASGANVQMSGGVELSGGINVVIAAVAGAIGGFIIVSVVILILDIPAYRRKKQEQLAQEAAAEGTDSKD